MILDHCACARLRRDANEMASSPRSLSCSPPLSPWKIKWCGLDYAKTNKLNRLRNKKWDMYVDCFLKSSRFKISVTLNNNKGTESGYAIKSVRIIPNEHNASLSHWKIIKEIEIDYYPKLKKKWYNITSKITYLWMRTFAHEWPDFFFDQIRRVHGSFET